MCFVLDINTVEVKTVSCIFSIYSTMCFSIGFSKLLVAKFEPEANYCDLL